MHHGQRCVAVFRWDDKLPGFDIENDPERLTTLMARAPAEAILSALRAHGYRTDVDAPYDGEMGWHFTVDVDGQTFKVFTLWTGIDNQDYFAVQLDLSRLFAILARKPVGDELLEPVCRALDRAFASIPRIIDIRWLTDEQFANSYVRGQPLPAAERLGPSTSLSGG